MRYYRIYHIYNVCYTLLVGMHDRSYEGGYEWTDKSPLTYSNWKDNQPNDATQTENCVLMDSRNGQWFDWRCGSYYAFICKKTLGMTLLLFSNLLFLSAINSMLEFKVMYCV